MHQHVSNYLVGSLTMAINFANVFPERIDNLSRVRKERRVELLFLSFECFVKLIR